MVTRAKFIDGSIAVILVIASVFLVGRTVFSGGHAPTPELFSNGYSFAQAKSMSEQTGKPIFVVASADWCGPCQAYKRGALADDDVRQAIQSSMIPVYVNVDEDPEAAAELSVYSIPLTAIVQGGEVKERYEGGLSTSKLSSLASEYGVLAQAPSPVSPVSP